MADISSVPMAIKEGGLKGVCRNEPTVELGPIKRRKAHVFIIDPIGGRCGKKVPLGKIDIPSFKGLQIKPDEKDK